MIFAVYSFRDDSKKFDGRPETRPDFHFISIALPQRSASRRVAGIPSSWIKSRDSDFLKQELFHITPISY